MEIAFIVAYRGKGIINLVVQAHGLQVVDVLYSNAAFFAERHFPITVKRAAGVYRYGQRIEACVLVPGHSKKSADRGFYRRFFFIVPIKTDDRELPVAGWCHPNMLYSTGAIHFGNGKS